MFKNRQHLIPLGIGLLLVAVLLGVNVALTQRLDDPLRIPAVLAAEANWACKGFRGLHDFTVVPQPKVEGVAPTYLVVSNCISGHTVTGTAVIELAAATSVPETTPSN